MIHAPETPTTQDLQQLHGSAEEAHLRITENRIIVSELLRGDRPGTLIILGQCAMSGPGELIEAESDRIAALSSAGLGITALHRMPPWKPRTNAADWHGLETTEPERAYQILTHQANRHANVAMELAFRSHMERYADKLTLGWSGGRNIENGELIEMLAVMDPSLPIGVKNGLDGNIETALIRAKTINSLREQGDAPAVLLYRGGDNAKTPADWEDQYMRVLDATDGKVIIDVAHGTEMAHDPKGGFGKSALGEELALRSIIKLAERGYIPAGLMMEASDTPSPTDPHMELEIALNGSRRMGEIAMRVAV